MDECDELLEVFEDSPDGDTCIDVVFTGIDHDNARLVLKDEAVDVIDGICQLRPTKTHVDDWDSIEVFGKCFPVFDTGASGEDHSTV